MVGSGESGEWLYHCHRCGTLMAVIERANGATERSYRAVGGVARWDDWLPACAASEMGQRQAELVNRKLGRGLK